jgi:hypothetical protein
LPSAFRAQAPLEFLTPVDDDAYFSRILLVVALHDGKKATVAQVPQATFVLSQHLGDVGDNPRLRQVKPVASGDVP